VVWKKVPIAVDPIVPDVNLGNDELIESPADFPVEFSVNPDASFGDDPTVLVAHAIVFVVRSFGAAIPRLNILRV
jgi:hypothetical protein